MGRSTFDYSGRFVLLAGLLIVCIAFFGVPVSAASWNISTVDGTGTEVGGSSLALDALGNPHVAYINDSGLVYAVWDDSGWTEETVTTFTLGGGDPTLVLDSSGNPHIAYVDLDSFSVRYAESNGTDWTFEAVDSPATVSAYVSLALDASDAPHISYFDDSVRDLKYAVRDGLVWENETVDGSGFWPEGRYNSLALNASGYPCISYFGFANDNLKYAAWDGSIWRIEIVDDESDVGQYTSLVLDAEGHPHISYQNGGDNDLKYAAWDGSEWSIETVGSSSQLVSGGTSLALDASGNPHIAYGANSGLQYAVWVGSVWTIETVDSYGSVMNPWLNVDASLVLDASGYPHIIYANKTLEDLMYAVQGEAPSAAFTGTPLTGTAPLTVTFTDASTNADAWDWTFGDGASLQEQNPVHMYTGSGIYNVTLTVRNIFGADTLTRSNYITVAPSVTAISPDSGLVNATVNGTLTGTGFVDGMAVALVGTGFPAINATNVNVTAETALSCTFNLTGASAGQRDVLVTAPAGPSGVLVDGFAVTTPSPTPPTPPVPTVPAGDDDDVDFVVTSNGVVLISPEGKLLRSLEIESCDGITTLALPDGTSALDAAGRPIRKITVTPVEEVAPLPEGTAFRFAGYACECSPSGAVFAPPITLTFTLSAEEWDAIGDGLSVRFYNEETGVWEEIPATVDATTHTVTAAVSHFSVFGLFSEATTVIPPEVTVPGTTPVTATTVVQVVEESEAPATPAGETTPTPTQSPMMWAPVGAVGLLFILKRRK